MFVIGYHRRSDDSVTSCLPYKVESVCRADADALVVNRDIDHVWIRENDKVIWNWETTNTLRF